MASSQATDKLFSKFYMHVVDHDPGATTAVIASPDGGTTPDYVDFRDYKSLAVVAAPHVVGGDLTLLEIVAATDAAFTTPVVVKAHAASTADALGDYVVLECNSDDLASAGDNLRYVAARITHATGTDESFIFYVAESRNPQDGLTSTTIA